MIHLYGDVHESMHLYLPASPLSATVLREIDIDDRDVRVDYKGGFHDPLIEQIAHAIRSEMVDPAPAGRMLAETLGTALAVHVLRNHSNIEPASTSMPSVRGGLDARRLRRVADYIEAHLGQDMSIETLANEACLSPFHFARAFKAATGTAPHRYLTDRRIDRARSLIFDGQMPLAAISEVCGFSSQAHFTRWFKRIVGVTPGVYREGCR